MSVNRFPIEEGAIAIFAASIRDPNLIYVDHEYARSSEFGGILAPPTFVQTSAHFDPDYPLRPRAGEPWLGSGRTSTGRLVTSDGEVTVLHAEQHYEYHRPL